MAVNTCYHRPLGTTCRYTPGLNKHHHYRTCYVSPILHLHRHSILFLNFSPCKMEYLCNNTRVVTANLLIQECKVDKNKYYIIVNYYCIYSFLKIYSKTKEGVCSFSQVYIVHYQSDCRYFDPDKLKGR